MRYLVMLALAAALCCTTTTPAQARHCRGLRAHRPVARMVAFMRPVGRPFGRCGR